MYDQIRGRQYKKRVPRTSIKSRARRPITKPVIARPARKAPLRTSPASAPNAHDFQRSYDFTLRVGVEDAANNVLLNTDGTYQIIKLQCAFNKLPDFAEFKDLYSEYKIGTVQHTLIPFFKQNMPFSNGISGDYGIAVPNYEIIILPATSSARQSNLEDMSKTEIDSFVNQTIRKSRRMLPSGIQTFATSNPTVVDYTGPLSKNAGTAAMGMGPPQWYNTDPSALVTGGIDQTAIQHYSMTLLLRRVDGLVLNSHGGGNNNYQAMGFRQETCVKFNCRKIQ